MRLGVRVLIPVRQGQRIQILAIKNAAEVNNREPGRLSQFPRLAAFLRFAGGAVGPYVALKLSENVSPHAPFWFGACAVLVGVVILVAGRRTVSGAFAPAAHSLEEAEVELVGDAA